MSKATVNKVILRAIHEPEFRTKLSKDFDAAIKSFAKTLTKAEQEGLKAASNKLHKVSADLHSLLLDSRITKGATGVR